MGWRGGRGELRYTGRMLNFAAPPLFDEVVQTRRSVRGFSARPVPAQVIREALELAQRSPSNCNAQPWRVVIATGERCERLRARLLEAFDAGEAVDEHPTPRFEAEYRHRQVACAAELYGKMGVAREDKPGRRSAERRNFELFDAPQVAIVTMDARFGVGVGVDVGCWVQTFLLSLWARGVGACAQASLRAYGELVRKEVGLDQGQRVLCSISFGYEDESMPANQARMSRVPVDECVRWLDA
jgi:hypothetical protein